MTERLSLKVAKDRLRRHGMSVNKSRYGEYRVNFVGGTENTAYYTTTLDDAIATGEAMAREGRLNWELTGQKRNRTGRIMGENPHSGHIAGRLTAKFIQTGRGGRSGPWAVVVDEVHPASAYLRHYNTHMLLIDRDQNKVEVLSTGHGSVSDQQGVNAAIKAVYGYDSPIGWFHRDRRGGGARVNPGRGIVMARRNPRRNPGGKSSILPLVLIGGAAFLLLRSGSFGSIFGNVTAPPATIPPGYTFVPGRGLVPSYQVTSPENQLIAAGIGAGIPVLGNLFGRVFDWAVSPSPEVPMPDVAGGGWWEGGIADILNPTDSVSL